jgi:hypothetical protein
MFRRYFSRVLFGVAALMFVVLWAYAHGTLIYVPQPTNLAAYGWFDGRQHFHSEHHGQVQPQEHDVTAWIQAVHWVSALHAASTSGSFFVPNGGLAFIDVPLSSWDTCLDLGNQTQVLVADTYLVADGENAHNSSTLTFDWIRCSTWARPTPAW